MQVYINPKFIIFKLL